MSQPTKPTSVKQQPETWWGYLLMLFGIVFWLAFVGFVGLSFKAALAGPGKIMRETKARENYRSFKSIPAPRPSRI